MVRAVAQRVRAASVSVDGATVGSIGRGLAILVGIREGDDEAAAERVADKLAVLRIFDDGAGKMNLSTSDVGGAMLVVSQFTLYADLRKGRRPSFIRAAAPAVGERLYEHFAARLQSHGYTVERGRFGAHMLVAIENDGPVTIVLDSEELS
ncbi:MAG: D-tyrosyl-tRNA(Tyr) deacylase [Chloroflexi bacterium]|nr:D-tyrosyl-tRNA(Tyr) deacylase [Chloroflexota bacterium]